MLDHPRLTSTEADEPAIAVSLSSSTDHSFTEPSRETFILSTRAAGLLVDDLGYEEREEVASMTTRALLLTGAAYVPEKKQDPVEVIQRLHTPEGGKHPTDLEVEHVAEYLKTSEIERRIRWLTVELVENTRLSTVMDPEEVRTQRQRMNDLRGIAKDL